jgi:carboxyl-terminal processing protease
MTEGFNYTTANELTASLRQLHKEGAKGLILDLRENPGGILEQAVRVAEKFLPAGSLILTQRGRSKLDNRVWTSTNHSPETMPLVLLVNENSASASEILAGALQDHDRALIIGQRTFGKGLVQSLFDGPEGTGLTLTTARYYTPSGRSIQRDYSDGRLYDYYNHRVDETTLKRIEAHTSANRSVFGGDGIEPDISITSHQMTKSERDIDDAVFFFTRDLLNGRLNSGFSLKMNIIKTALSESSDSNLNDQLFIEFQKYAKSVPNDALSGIDLATERTFIGERVSFYITLARKGDVLANRLNTTDDLPVLKALSELPRARELAIASLSKH